MFVCTCACCDFCQGARGLLAVRATEVTDHANKRLLSACVPCVSLSCSHFYIVAHSHSHYKMSNFFGSLRSKVRKKSSADQPSETDIPKLEDNDLSQVDSTQSADQAEMDATEEQKQTTSASSSEYLVACIIFPCLRSLLLTKFARSFERGHHEQIR